MPESEINDDNDDAEEQLPPKEDPALLARLRSDGEQVLAEAFDANRERFWHLISEWIGGLQPELTLMMFCRKHLLLRRRDWSIICVMKVTRCLSGYA